MICVADASPLNSLILIREIGILAQLFDEALMPVTVLSELRAAKAPVDVSDWCRELPPWVSVRSGESRPELGLDPGETEAIQIALETKGILVVDDRLARGVAERVGIKVIGKVGIHEEADRRGLTQMQEALAALARTIFRLSQTLLEQLQNNSRG